MSRIGLKLDRTTTDVESERTLMVSKTALAMSLIIASVDGSRIEGTVLDGPVSLSTAEVHDGGIHLGGFTSYTVTERIPPRHGQTARRKAFGIDGGEKPFAVILPLLSINAEVVGGAELAINVDTTPRNRNSATITVDITEIKAHGIEETAPRSEHARMGVLIFDLHHFHFVVSMDIMGCLTRGLSNRVICPEKLHVLFG
jgi:hypothetical protein